jgi:circadian clock protein KaiB
MNDDPKKSVTEKFEELLNAPESEAAFLLRLYVSGMTPRSIRAIEKIKEICRTRLKGRYDLEVIDIYQHPEMGKIDQIVAVPTLLKKLPTPLRKFIGDLSDTEKILVGLDLKPRPSTTESPNE